jgi:hypothetical protein
MEARLNENIENNPMQSSMVRPFERSPQKHFDTSGKSPAYLHRRKN